MKTLIALLLTAANLAAAGDVTFHRDVLPVLQQNCQGCHRPGEVGPMSFLTYSSTRPWAKAIKQAVLAKRMPPWFADDPHGRFSNDPSLSKEQIETLARWADTGAPEGDPKLGPPPIRFADGWNIGKPDLVVEMPRPFEVPATGDVEYQHVIVPLNFSEDRWVQGVEIRPGNRELVHHIIAFVRPRGSSWFEDGKPGVPAPMPREHRTVAPAEMPEFLLSYTPGRPAVALPKGQARLIPAGSDLVFQLHYTTNGKAGSDRSKVGLIFAKERPAERVATLPIANRTFAIPPGDANYRVDASARVENPARLLRMIPHMHLRGKAFEVAVLNGQGEDKLLRVPKYDFRWQNAYYLKQPVELKPGEKIECRGWFDNSPNNPWNPDPKAEVRWGDQTYEEMMLGYVDVALPADQDPKKVLARPSPAAAGSIRDRFIGVWSLVSVKTTNLDGSTTLSYGDRPTGRITYDKAGRMSAQLMRDGRKPYQDLRTATEDQMRDVLTGFTAYYGTFDVDESKGVVIHHVKLALNPSWIGTDLVRTYEFTDDKLILTAKQPTGATIRLVWQKEKD